MVGDGEIWDHLRRGQSLKLLGLPQVDGRADLRKIAVNRPIQIPTNIPGFEQLVGHTEVKKGSWRDIDFSGVDLRSLRFLGATIDNCRFDEANLSDLRMWNTRIVGSTFRGANLQGSALGPLDRKGRRNRFEHVDFSDADLRGCAFTSATMSRCTFANTNLREVDFGGTVFARCTFAGLLEEVRFNKFAWRGETLPPNEMHGVSFKNATLRFVEFKHLDLREVEWPDDDAHFIVNNYKEVLEQLLAIWAARTDEASRVSVAVFEAKRRVAGDNQKVGLLSIADLIEFGGKTAVDDVRHVLESRRGLASGLRRAFGRLVPGGRPN